MHFAKLLLILCEILHLSTCARILCVFPTPSYSHQIVFRGYTEELLKNGHQLVVVTPNPSGIISPNITEIDISFSYITWNRLMNSMRKDLKWWEVMLGFREIVNEYLEEQLATKEFQDLISDRTKFDLLVVEYLCYPAIFMLKELYQIPAIGITSMDLLINGHESVGNIPHLIMYPDSHYSPLLKPKSIYEKFTVILPYTFYTFVYYNYYIPEQNELVKKYLGRDLKDISEVDMNMDLVFVNANPVLGFSRPVVPTYIDISGIHMKPVQPLSKDVQTFLDDSKNGVILFSLGTNVKSEHLPYSIQIRFIEVFSNLPYGVIWKREADDSLELPDNIKIYPWIQQSDILAHPNMKLFIFHGGYQSYLEAVANRVPMIAIPFFGDQNLNAQRIEHLKIGNRIDLKNLGNLSDVITATIEDNMYFDNVKRVSEVLFDNPQTIAERAIWWTDYVLRHNGTKHLRPLVPLLPYVQLLYLDVILVTMFAVIGSIIITCTVIRYILNRLHLSATETTMRNKIKTT